MASTCTGCAAGPVWKFEEYRASPWEEAWVQNAAERKDRVCETLRGERGLVDSWMRDWARVNASGAITDELLQVRPGWAVWGAADQDPFWVLDRFEGFPLGLGALGSRWT
jgi:hypothetical protein